MSLDSKQCRACCNLDSMLTIGYPSYVNECREVNLYIQLDSLDRDGSVVIAIDLLLDREGSKPILFDPSLIGCSVLKLFLDCLPYRPVVANKVLGRDKLALVFIGQEHWLLPARTYS